MRTIQAIHSIALRLAGCLILLVPFIPLELIFGPIKGLAGSYTYSFWLLGFVLLGTCSWLLCALLGERVEKSLRACVDFLSRVGKGYIFVCLTLMAIVLSIVSAKAFHFRPHNVDSIAQLFQAKIFVEGLAKLPRPDYPAFFVTLNTILDESGWYAQYPPGHSALLALGVISFGAYLVPIVLSLGTALFIYLFSFNIFGRTNANVSLLLLLMCPFFFFMGASFMNHVSALFFLSFAYWSFSEWEKSERNIWAVCVGLGFALAFLSRPLTSVALGVPLIVFIVLRLFATKQFWSLFFFAIAFVPVSSLFFVYNKLTTGDFLTTGYSRLWGIAHGLGFHVSPWGQSHTALGGLRNELIDLSLMNEYLFEWPIPSLFFIGLYFLSARLDDYWSRRLLVCFFMLPCAYFFYWHRDAYLGPRFFYSGILCLIPLSAQSLIWFFENTKQVKFRVFGLFNEVRLSSFLAVMFVFSLLYALGLGIPQRFSIYASSYSSMKFDVVEHARKEGIEKSILFLPVSWGNRLISQLRELGVEASRIEQVYNSVDHCLLDSVVKTAISESRDANWLAGELDVLVARNDKVVKARLTQDPTLRLRAGIKLSSVCEDEVRYDLNGFMSYVSSLHDMDIVPGTGFILARDLRSRNQLLMDQFPSHPAYLYRSEKFAKIK